MSDIFEDDIQSQMPHILKILLLDRTASSPKEPRNIIWANDNYIEYDAVSYAPTSPIRPELITGNRGTLIQPRALKAAALQKKRTRTKAEVFTPVWIVKKQNDCLDARYNNDDLETYVRRKWLEIACGEAPYMATRYEMGTGELVPLADRVGFVDRKLARINRLAADKSQWLRLAELAYQASYGFEWNGDSLLLARENLLYTYQDYYVEKWNALPDRDAFKRIAEIISYNIFQMDGLTYTIPLSGKKERVEDDQMLELVFDEPEKNGKAEWRTTPGLRVKIMNWDANKMEFFDKGLK